MSSDYRSYIFYKFGHTPAGAAGKVISEPWDYSGILIIWTMEEGASKICGATFLY